MISCRKCGSYDISGPFYQKHNDTLKYVCRRCGYARADEPKDSRAADRFPEPGRGTK